MGSKIPEPPSRELTSESLYLRRREFLKNAGLFAATATGVGSALYLLAGRKAPRKGPPRIAGTRRRGRRGGELAISSRRELAGGEAATPWDDVTTYNNFYELGTDKSDPAAARRHAPHRGRGRSTIDGEVKKPRTARRRRALQAGSRSRSASTGCAASRPGRW